MRWKRAILLGAAALVAGAVVNVGVAWGILLWPIEWSAGSYRAPTAEMPARHGWLFSVAPAWSHPTRERIIPLGRNMQDRVVWCVLENGSMRSEYIQHQVEVGWPCFGMATGHRVIQSFVITPTTGQANCTGVNVDWPADAWSGGVSIEPLIRSLTGKSAINDRMPIRPLWPGFAVNTLVYAAVVSVPFWLFGAIRRWRRRANWQCDRCGYDRRGLALSAACPECGHPSPPSGATAR